MGQARRRKSSEKGKEVVEGGEEEEDARDPATTLQAMAGTYWSRLGRPNMGICKKMAKWGIPEKSMKNVAQKR